ncbi:hypothetical protein [Ralstonia mannitolilytica]|uniref:Uncharacterized protein n=1 Tax=Ralstonia mannitolilytica TaxID=105219 RepID=A0AAD2AKQ0_9RALS|nr:hypothetical protein [Ralstonia mannitolilytica]MBY4719664.1 hypothetical protein [Ralstonia mannitolilytica]CAJ0681913.1 hypothetical protein R77591_01572 [Ralstonia mannitolilytica]CAJ0701930.1 hypothetical protein LMG18102_03592 [Ralstonia mannitolilytica]CAJ0866595.1 hypothetical protein R77569_01900 [Ralstonia mannitolilytica]
MRAWSIQQFRGCSIHVLAVVGQGIDFTYAYTGFVCGPSAAAMEFPHLERFHHTSADFDSNDTAIFAGMHEGRAIVERWFSSAAEHSAAR